MTGRARANGEGSIFPYRNGYAETCGHHHRYRTAPWTSAGEPVLTAGLRSPTGRARILSGYVEGPVNQRAGPCVHPVKVRAEGGRVPGFSLFRRANSR